MSELNPRVTRKGRRKNTLRVLLEPYELHKITDSQHTILPQPHAKLRTCRRRSGCSRRPARHRFSPPARDARRKPEPLTCMSWKPSLISSSLRWCVTYSSIFILPWR